MSLPTAHSNLNLDDGFLKYVAEQADERAKDETNPHANLSLAVTICVNANRLRTKQRISQQTYEALIEEAKYLI
jgi:hypothetical protein